MEFDKFANNYNTILDKALELSGEGWAYFAEQKARYLQAKFGPDFSGKILDYGCGIGNLLTVIHRFLPQAEVHGYDVSADSIAVLKKSGLNGHFTSDVAALRQDYDIIIMASVLHHVEVPQRSTVYGDVAARLAPGGQLIVIEHNPWNPLTQWSVRHSPFDVNVTLLPSPEVIGYAKAAGLNSTYVDYVVFFPSVLKFLRRLEPWLAWLPLGAQYVVIGRRP